MDLDPPLPPDVASVLRAAAILDVPEYELFRLAWRHWHGEEAATAVLERHFAAYMFHRVVPPWVRHFARRVEERWRAGTLDPQALGVLRRRGSRAMVRRGARYAVAAGLVLGVVVVLAQAAAQLMQLGERCLFPPCY